MEDDYQQLHRPQYNKLRPFGKNGTDNTIPSYSTTLDQRSRLSFEEEQYSDDSESQQQPSRSGKTSRRQMQRTTNTSKYAEDYSDEEYKPTQYRSRVKTNTSRESIHAYNTSEDGRVHPTRGEVNIKEEPDFKINKGPQSTTRNPSISARRTTSETEKSQPQDYAIVPYKTYTEEGDDSDSDDVVMLKKPKKNKKIVKLYDDSDRESDNESKDSVGHKGSLYNLFLTMTCAPQYATSLAILKTLIKKSDLVEIAGGNPDKRRHVRLSDYFPQNYTGSARKLKRWMQRVLQYSAMVATSDEARADTIADGPGLNEACVSELEQTARVPLPGLAIEKYTDDSIGRKRRALDLLLTFVILFFHTFEVWQYSQRYLFFER